MASVSATSSAFCSCKSYRKAPPASTRPFSTSNNGTSGQSSAVSSSPQDQGAQQQEQTQQAQHSAEASASPDSSVERTKQALENLRSSVQDACAKILPVSLAGVNNQGPSPLPSTPRHSTKNYRPPTPPTGIPLSRIFSNTFPLPLSEAYEQWTNRAKLQEAEEGVLSHLPFFPTPDATRSARSLQIPVHLKNSPTYAEQDLWINEFEITPHKFQPNTKGNHELVMLHGYGAGLAFYYRNFDEISSFRDNWRIHALDLLGYGRSARPKFVVNAKDPYDKIRETEDFFIDALEDWRKRRNIDTFTMVAHSMGGYLSSAYATKYPGHINKLVLVSPAGVPRSRYSISALERRARGEIDTTVPKTSVEIPAWFNFLWEQHVSPFSLIRNTGPLGPRFVSGWTARRFANLPKSEADALHKYVYTIFNAAGSGEYALNYLLAPGAHARWPLAERAAAIPCETEWMYGQNDWMDVSGGIEAITNIRKARGERGVNAPPPLHIVESAGHHIYLDNPQKFNELVKNTMREIEEKEDK